jgi:hypothetical protein
VPGASRGSLNKLDAIRSSLEAKLRTSLQSNKEIELEQGLAQSEAARRKDQSSSLEPSLQSKKKSEKHNDSANDVEIPEAERRRLDERAGVVPWEAAANQHNIVPDCCGTAVEPIDVDRTGGIPVQPPRACAAFDAAHDAPADAPQRDERELAA